VAVVAGSSLLARSCGVLVLQYRLVSVPGCGPVEPVSMFVHSRSVPVGVRFDNGV
jgi:hypothetical protein